MNKKPIHAKILKALNISDDRYEHIVSYVTQMIIDYRGNVDDILKEIPLNLKGNEKYFTMFIIGNSSSPSFSIINDEEREKFITSTANSLKISEERTISLTDYVANTIIEDIEKNHTPIVDTIKIVINGNFTETEKDYIMFLLGLALTSDYEEHAL